MTHQDLAGAVVLGPEDVLVLVSKVYLSDREVASLKEGFAGVANVERRQEQTYVTVLSPQYALLSGTGRTKVSLEDGRTFESPFAVSMIFQMREGTWKVLQGHFSIPNR